MSPAHNQALDQALGALRAPALFLRLRARPLPDDVLLLLKIVAGESHSRDLACANSGETVDVVAEAATQYIQQVMFYPGSDSHRLLGVSAAADGSQIKEHHRWLVRWLHPDRNTEQWDAVYADRVNKAWQDLRTPERRQDYVSRLPPAVPTEEWPSGINPLAESFPVANWSSGDEFVLPSRVTRLLPLFVMGGLVLAASTFLWLQYQVNRSAAKAQVVTVTTRAAVENSPATARQKIPEASEKTIAALANAVDAPQPIVLPQPIEESPSIARQVSRVAESRAIAVASAPPPEIARYAVSIGTPARTTHIEAIRTSSIPDRPPPRIPVVAAVPRRRANDIASASVVEPASNISTALSLDSPEMESLIDAAAARAVIMRFRSAYSSGNINQFRDLLASKTLDDHGERKSILKAYGKLFETSASRRIEIHDPDWLTDGDTAVLIANYDAWILPRGESTERHFFGKIRFDLRSEDGELRVARLRHDAAGG